jgi:ankyrin repeat protein
MLIRAKANLDVSGAADLTGNFFTPVFLATAVGNYAVLQQLLETGASTAAPKEGVHTALFSACFKRRADVIDLLLQYSADTKATVPSGETPLWSIVCFNEPGITKSLIQHGAPITGPIGSCLVKAVWYGHFETIEALASVASADEINFSDGSGYTALGVAATLGRLAIVKLLHSHGARVDVKHRGGFPLDLVVIANSPTEIVLELFSRELSPMTVEAGLRLINFAAAKGDTKILSAVLERSGDGKALVNYDQTRSSCVLTKLDALPLFHLSRPSPTNPV